MIINGIDITEKYLENRLILKNNPEIKAKFKTAKCFLYLRIVR